MDKMMLISMFVSFATSNDILKFEPHQQPQLSAIDGDKPEFCKKLDCPNYRVVSTTPDYEERQYSVSSWVSTNLLDVDYDVAGTTMFMRLFKYISGNNADEKKIAMTAPVTNRIIPGEGPACESNFTMSFFIAPSVGKAPAPKDSTVFLNKLKPFTVYVRQFSGFTYKFSDWAKEAVALGEALNKAGLSYETGYYYTAGYDAPFTLFNRHNEIWFLKK